MNRLSISLIASVYLFLFFFASATAHGQEVSKAEAEVEKEAKSQVCAFCKMGGVEKSPVLIKVRLSGVGTPPGKDKDLVFDSLGCWLQYEDKLEKQWKVASVTVLDYPTRGDKKPKFIELKKAFFVEAGPLDKSMPPYLVAFSSKEKASALAKEKKKNVLTYAEAEEFVKKKLGIKKKEEEKSGHEAHHM